MSLGALVISGLGSAQEEEAFVRRSSNLWWSSWVLLCWDDSHWKPCLDPCYWSEAGRVFRMRTKELGLMLAPIYKVQLLHAFSFVAHKYDPEGRVRRHRSGPDSTDLPGNHVVAVVLLISCWVVLSQLQEAYSVLYMSERICIDSHSMCSLWGLHKPCKPCPRLIKKIKFSLNLPR